ncbi:uncharacterized protein LOC114939063 [Nylanderia fulva]|uniref:uncharacterized protein LOC114939063 n=1 Tax=Nylanderia fulva TaxID=613905 RepID=UPI0010FAF9A9|nr:uncharacterized protein LOC114939063 [Nylanderia fulva]
MSEMTSVVETQQQHQQYVGDNSNARHHCKECNVNFDSEASLKVHLQYHDKNNLLNQWANKAQQEESNNNHSKTGNHNSHVNVNRDSVTILADSSEPSTMSPSQDSISLQQQQPQQQQQQQQQPQQQQSAIQLIPPYDHFPPMFNESSYYINEQSYMIPHHFSPSQEDAQNNRDSNDTYPRYHLYQHPQIYSADRTTSNSTSPHSPPLQCDKCGAVFEDTNQLGEHMRTNHLESPSAYPPAPQYGSHLGHSPQQLHPSPPLPNQPQQQPGYDYNGGQTNKMDMKQEPEEQAEILDLDSHKVQTHRFEEEYLRMQQQQQQQQQHQQQGLQMQIQQRLIPHQQHQQHRIGSHSVSSMLGNHWLPTQSHDYHPGLGSMGPVDNVPPSIPDQGQFMRSQHMPVEHGHQNSPIITSTQPMTGHQMRAGLAQQSSQAPPLANQSWKSNEARRPKTYNCTACNKWFTSSGHLKRHYNTTLHKNAVKNGKEPDPATLPISNHHHPTRENSNNSSRGGGAPARSTPDLPSSRSPPNLMAGPSAEATRGLLHTPTTHCSSNNSSAPVLVQQPVVHLMHPGVMPVTSPVPSSLAGHHQQPMGSAPHQLGLQQQRQLHLRTDSPGQSVHHTTSSPIPPQAALHMNCPSPMDSSHQHHMNSLQGSVHPAMTSPTAMRDTTMPHQPYPNALPPHVTIITHPVLLEPTQRPTLQLPTSMVGNAQNEQQQLNVLPSFTIFDHKTNYTPVVGLINDNLQVITNVGGLALEAFTPQESIESSSTISYDTSTISYDSSNKLHLSPNVVTNIEQSAFSYPFEHPFEQNNNHLLQLEQKENIDPNINVQPKRGRKRKLPSKEVTTPEAKYISLDGVHKCVHCDKYFGKSCYLTQHNKSSHSGEKPFKCAKCGKRYADKESHDKHVGVHEKEKKYGCDICPKRFAHKTDLKRHVYTHKTERPFKCSTCSKGFIRNDHMKKHALTHNKVKTPRITKKRKTTTTSPFDSQQAGEFKDFPTKY